MTKEKLEQSNSILSEIKEIERVLRYSELSVTTKAAYLEMNPFHSLGHKYYILPESINNVIKQLLKDRILELEHNFELL